MRVELMAGRLRYPRTNTEEHRSWTFNENCLPQIRQVHDERPLHMGATLSGNSTPELIFALSEYGLPLGRLFNFVMTYLASLEILLSQANRPVMICAKVSERRSSQ
jgi:hypothetical protein